MKIIVMGVTGCGKSTVGVALAQRLGCAFIDGDDLHPEMNKKKMSSGVPLDDRDRVPWLEEVSKSLQLHDAIVIACSALKKSYRTTITKGAPSTVFIHLKGSKDLITARLRERSGHFMPIGLLDSQIQTLEQLEVDEIGEGFEISQSVEDIVDQIMTWFSRVP